MVAVPSHGTLLMQHTDCATYCAIHCAAAHGLTTVYSVVTGGEWEDWSFVDIAPPVNDTDSFPPPYKGLSTLQWTLNTYDAVSSNQSSVSSNMKNRPNEALVLFF